MHPADVCPQGVSSSIPSPLKSIAANFHRPPAAVQVLPVKGLACRWRRYALFYLLREVGTFTGSIGAFVDLVRHAATPADQMKTVNAYRPPEVCRNDSRMLYCLFRQKNAFIFRIVVLGIVLGHNMALHNLHHHVISFRHHIRLALARGLS